MRLAELGLDLETEPEETALDLLGELTDPELARKLLERAIGEATPERHGLRLDACTPEVLSYKRGRRAVIRYRLDGATRPIPATVVAKTYKRERTGQVAWDAMTALWRSPLGGGEVVTIAEPLAWIAEQRLLVQGPVPEELTLEDLLAAAFAEPDAAAMQRARHFVRLAAAGLAALHRSGVGLGETVTWREQHEQIIEMLGRIRAAVPDAGLDEAIGPLLRRFEQLGAATGAATAPPHGSFAPEQVLIHGGRIALIDFDAYCQAEPAMDAGEFVAALPDLATKAGSGLDVADALAEEFLAAYERLAPLSRERVTLWHCTSPSRRCAPGPSRSPPAVPATSPSWSTTSAQRSSEPRRSTPSRSPAIVTAPRRSAWLARRTRRRSPSPWMPNLSYSRSRWCLTAVSVITSTSAPSRCDAGSVNASPTATVRHSW